MTNAPTPDDNAEPTPNELVEAAESCMIDAIQDFARARSTHVQDPRFTAENADDPSVLVGWVLVFDMAHSDGSRSLDYQSSEGMPEWGTAGMLSYVDKLVSASVNFDFMQREMDMRMESDDDGDE